MFQWYKIFPAFGRQIRKVRAFWCFTTNYKKRQKLKIRNRKFSAFWLQAKKCSTIGTLKKNDKLQAFYVFSSRTYLFIINISCSESLLCTKKYENKILFINKVWIKKLCLQKFNYEIVVIIKPIDTTKIKIIKCQIWYMKRQTIQK